MTVHVYADESGNFDFSQGVGATKFFILASVTVDDDVLGADLRALQKDLINIGVPVAGGFHASEDRQHVRDRVFNLLKQHDFRIDATIIEKRKVRTELQNSHAQFYGFAWRLHLAGLISMLSNVSGDIHIMAASIGTNAMQRAFISEVRTTENKMRPDVTITIDIQPALSSSMLQVADYCAWALRRKWELDDMRSYSLIGSKIESEYDVFTGIFPV